MAYAYECKRCAQADGKECFMGRTCRDVNEAHEEGIAQGRALERDEVVAFLAEVSLDWAFAERMVLQKFAEQIHLGRHKGYTAPTAETIERGEHAKEIP